MKKFSLVTILMVVILESSWSTGRPKKVKSNRKLRAKDLVVRIDPNEYSPEKSKLVRSRKIASEEGRVKVIQNKDLESTNEAQDEFYLPHRW